MRAGGKKQEYEADELLICLMRCTARQLLKMPTTIFIAQFSLFTHEFTARWIISGCSRVIIQKFHSPLSFCRYSYMLHPWRTAFRSVHRRGKIIFFSTASRPAVGPTQWVPAAVFPGKRRRGREAYHLPPSSAQIRNCRAIPPHLILSSWPGA
jgi:hypothetical protein